MSRLARFAVAALAVATFFSASAMAEEPVEPVFVEQQVFFHQAATKLGNLAALGHDTFPSWNTTAPATVTGGNGAGYVGNMLTEIPLGDHTAESGPTFVGAFSGPINTLAVDLFAFSNPGDAAQGLRVQLTIDDIVVHQDADPFSVPLKPGGQAVRQLNFAVTGIHDVMEANGLSTAADSAHTIRINVVPFYVGDDAMYVYDAAEAPSGMVFNPAADKLKRYVSVAANG